MKNTKIEWCHHTFNPWIGCTKISPACDNCYAEQIASRFGMAQWGDSPRKLTSPQNWKQPERWNRQARIKEDAWNNFIAQNPGLTDAQLIEKGFIKPERPRVFCGSMCDVFDNSVPLSYRANLFNLVSDTPNLDWLFLTKRIGYVQKLLEKVPAYKKAMRNVWLGITVCNQEEADRDIPKLLQTPAAKRFLSIEPMLGPIDLSPYLKTRQEEGRTYPGVDWVIVGGESGLKARPMHPGWALSIRDQCKAAGVPFFFKQWGECVPYEWHAQPPFLYSQHGDLFDAHHLPDFESDDPKYGWISDNTNMVFYRRVGKKKAGCLLDGIEYKEVPA